MLYCSSTLEGKVLKDYASSIRQEWRNLRRAGLSAGRALDRMSTNSDYTPSELADLIGPEASCQKD